MSSGHPSPRPGAAERTLALPDGHVGLLTVRKAAGTDAAGGPGLRGPVVYLHGIQSHPGWFAGSAAALAAAGHDVYQPTRRGSGADQVSPGHADSAGQLLDDLAAVVRHAVGESGVDRVHLAGVSWGGKLAAAAAATGRAGAPVASLTLIAPGIAPRVDVSPWTKLRIGLSLLFRPWGRFAIPLNEPQLFTDNPVRREYIAADPLRLRRATAKFLWASRCLDRMIARAPEGAVVAPTTLLLAQRDRIIDNPRTRHVVARLTAGRAEVRSFPAAHTLEFEPDPAAFHAALLAAVARGEA